MRVRSMLTLSTGAALGAGVMYLLDPEHGAARRRDARRQLLRQARQGAGRAVVDARRRAAELSAAAITGYHQSRMETAPHPAPPPVPSGRDRT